MQVRTCTLMLCTLTPKADLLPFMRYYFMSFEYFLVIVATLLVRLYPSTSILCYMRLIVCVCACLYVTLVFYFTNFYSSLFLLAFALMLLLLLSRGRCSVALSGYVVLFGALPLYHQQQQLSSSSSTYSSNLIAESVMDAVTAFLGVVT